VLAGLNRSDLPVRGGVNLTAEVNGTLDSPEATVAVQGHEISAYHQPLGQLEARARLQDRRVEVSDLRLSDGALQASAEYGLDSREYRKRLVNRSS